MADNVTTTTTVSTVPSGTVIATSQVTYSGDTAHVGIAALGLVTGAEGSKTLTDVSNSAPIPVSDAAGSLTVDNGGTFAVQATVAAAATNIAKAEDVAAADADVGVPAMAVRKATPANTSGTDGDYEMLQMAAGRLWVDASGVSLTVAAHAVTNAGTFAVQESGAALTSLQLIDDVVFAEDAAHVSADKGIMALALRRDTTPSSSSGTAGDYSALNVDANGRMYSNASLYTPNGDSAMDDTNDAVKVVAVTTSTSATGSAVPAYASMIGGTDGTNLKAVSVNTSGNLLPLGTVAHDGVDSGAPIKVGARALAAPSTATMVASADRTDLVADLDGFLLARRVALGDVVSTSQSVTDTTSTAATGFGAVASTKNHLTQVTVWNSSATATFVKIQDGSGGTTLWAIPAPAGGGATVHFDPPLRQATANTALYFAANASASTVYVSINGFKSKV